MDAKEMSALVAELQERMYHHDVVDGVAVVQLTARELEQLLEFIRDALGRDEA